MLNIAPRPICFNPKPSYLAAILVSATSLLATNAYAKGSFADQLGVSGQCTLCHNSPDGGFETLKPAALQAYQNGGVKPGLENYLKSLQGNAKPVILPIDSEWNVHIGQTLSIPLTIKDDEDEGFAIQLAKASPTIAAQSYNFAAFALNTNGQPFTTFKWTPSASQTANKVYTLSFRATEALSNGTIQVSVPIATKAYLWPKRPLVASHVLQHFKVNSAKWGANKLVLTGNIAFKTSATTAARNTALANLRLKLKSFGNAAVGVPIKLTVNSAGNWSSTVSLTGVQVPCIVKAEYEQLIAARTVKSVPATCKK
jgi:hypothetical protein